MSSVEWTEESIQTAYQKIWKYELDWVILGYEIGTPKRIGIKSSGSTVDLFVSNFKEDEILLGYIRYDQAAMFIHFLPKSISEKENAYSLLHAKKTIKSFFPLISLKDTIVSIDQLSVTTIVQSLSNMKPIGPPPPIQTHKPKQNNESKVRFTVLANHLNIQDLMDLPFNPLTEMKQLEIELDQNQSSQSELELTHQFGNFKNQLINDNMKTSVEMEPVKIEQNNQKNSHRGGMILNISKENLPILNSLVKVSQESLELDDSNNDSVQALDKRVDDTITNGKQQESKANSSVRDIKPSSTNNEGKTDTINKPFQIAIKSSLTKSFSLENIKMKVNKKLNPNKLNPLQISLEAPKLAEKSASLPAIVVTPPPTASKLHHEIPSPDINNKPIQLNTNKLTSMSATSNARKGQMKIHEQWVSFKGPKDSIATKKWLRIQKGLMSVYETDKELVSNLEIKLDNQINMLDVTMDEMGNSGVSFSIRDDTYSIFGKQNDVTPFRKIFINSRN